jgi:integrase
MLSEITDNEIAEYVARRRAHVANASVNRETQLLKRVLRRAATTWKVDTGEAIDWRPGYAARAHRTHRGAAQLRGSPVVPAPPRGHAPAGPLRLAEWCALDERSAAHMVTGGLREPRDRVPHQKQAPGGEVHTLPITQAMLVLLAEQRGGHPIYVFTYVCKRSRGQRRKGERYPFSKNGWRKDWWRALEAAGIEDFRFHDLRHTAATRVLRASNNLKVVQEMLGHSDIGTTARYAHAMKEDVRAAMERAQSRNTPETVESDSSKSLEKKA